MLVARAAAHHRCSAAAAAAARYCTSSIGGIDFCNIAPRARPANNECTLTRLQQLFQCKSLGIRNVGDFPLKYSTKLVAKDQ
jgi:hypothetical protein